MHSWKHISVIGIVLALTLISGTASAADVWFWSSIGGACVPADEDVQVDNYDTRGFGVGFKGTATGSIRLLCAVNHVPDCAPRMPVLLTQFRMSYTDSDGMSTQARVRATLRRVAVGSAVSSAISTADSDTSNATSPNAIVSDFPNFYQFADNLYFEILIERSSATQNPEFLSLFLIGACLD